MMRALTFAMLLAMPSLAAAEDAISGYRISLNPDQMESMQSDIAYAMYDPESARFRNIKAMQDPKKGVVACGELNSKNRMGGYVGFTPFVAFLKPNDPKWQFAIGVESELEMVNMICAQAGLLEATPAPIAKPKKQVQDRIKP